MYKTDEKIHDLRRNNSSCPEINWHKKLLKKSFSYFHPIHIKYVLESYETNSTTQEDWQIKFTIIVAKKVLMRMPSLF